jgi:hypothetical protein
MTSSVAEIAQTGRLGSRGRIAGDVCVVYLLDSPVLTCRCVLL